MEACNKEGEKERGSFFFYYLSYFLVEFKIEEGAETGCPASVGRSAGWLASWLTRRFHVPRTFSRSSLPFQPPPFPPRRPVTLFFVMVTFSPFRKKGIFATLPLPPPLLSGALSPSLSLLSTFHGFPRDPRTDTLTTWRKRRRKRRERWAWPHFAYLFPTKG